MNEMHGGVACVVRPPALSSRNSPPRLLPRVILRIPTFFSRRYLGDTSPARRYETGSRRAGDGGGQRGRLVVRRSPSTPPSSVARRALTGNGSCCCCCIDLGECDQLNRYFRAPYAYGGVWLAGLGAWAT